MLAYWMPYLKLTYPDDGREEYKIGKAVFVDDTPTNWSGMVGCPRPEILKIHRNFPTNRGGETVDAFGDPLYGTLMYCEDEKWLEDHAEAVVGVLYFVCNDSAGSLPAECFAYQQIRLPVGASTDGSGGVFFSKHLPAVESTDSIRLLPPLAVRGNQEVCFPDFDTPEHQGLLRRISDGPLDRLVVAARHYFRTQFTDVFTSPFDQDYAFHCGAIEAALGIDGRKGDVGKTFTQELLKLYGTEDRFKEFFDGLYNSRSLFVHGASVAPDSTDDPKIQAYRLFKSIPDKISLMRALTRDVICHALGRGAGLPFLRKVLHSDATWQEVKRILTKCRAADQLVSMVDVEFKQVEALASKLAEYFDWRYVKPPADRKHVLACIRTCAIAIGKLTDYAGEVYKRSDQLGNAAHRGDDDAIRKWVFDGPWKDLQQLPGDRLSTIQRLARSLVRYFVTQRILA